MDPIASNGTPMCRALSVAENLVATWVAEHPECFPPIVLNLTDGEANDGDPLEAASMIQTRASADGAALLFNLHVSGGSSTSITFPDNPAGLPDTYAQKLFDMSSILPSHMRSYATQLGFPASDNARGFVYNADIASIVQFLDIGTRATELR
jgi:hypothetical protein